MAIVTQKIITDRDSEFGIYELIANFGGINQYDSPDNVKDTETDEESNCVSDPVGAISKRPGYTKVNSQQPTGNKAWTGLYQARFKAGAEDIGISGSKVYRISAAGALTDITGAISLTDDQNNLIDSIVLRDQFLFTGRSVDGLFYLTAGAAAALAVGGSPPDCFAIAPFMRRVFALGDPALPNLLYYSSNTDNHSWNTGTDFLNMDEDDNDYLTAIRKFGNRLIVWKNRKTMEVSHTGTIPPFTYDTLDEETGCPSQQGHQLVTHPAKGPILYWLSEDNIIELSGRYPKPIGFKIKPVLKALNKARFQLTTSGVIYDLNIVFWNFTLGGETSHSFTIVYDFITEQFRLWKTGIQANCVSMRVSGGKKYTWFGNYLGEIHQLNSGDSDGDELDQLFATGTDDYVLGNDAGKYHIYQVFQAGKSDTFRRIKVPIKKVGTPTGKLTAKLFSVDDNDKPETQIEISPTKISVESLTTDYQDIDFVFSSDLTSGTKYAVVITCPSVDSSNYVVAESKSTGGYANGNCGYGPIGAISDVDLWTAETSKDIRFSTFVGGVDIDAWRELPWLDVGYPNFLKIWRFLTILFIPTGDWDLEVQYKTDFQDSWQTPRFPTSGLVNLLGGDTLGGTFTLSQSKLGNLEGKEAEIELGVEAKRLKIRFRNQNANEKFIIAGLGLVFEPVGFQLIT